MTKHDTDPFDALLAARPTDAELERAFPANHRSRVYAGVTGASPGRVRHGKAWHRWLAVVAAAIIVTAGLFLRDMVTDGSAPRADAITVLALTAGQSTDLSIPNGKFLEQTVTENPAGAPIASDAYAPDGQPYFPRVMHSWTGSDGHVWRCDVAPSGVTEYFHFPAPPEQWSPAAVAALPIDSDDLLSVLSARANGSNSQDEAIFELVKGILTLGYTPPAVQQAAIQTLAALSPVTVHRGAAPSGRELLQVQFHDRAIRGPEAHSLWFDESLGRVVETSSENIDTGQVTFVTTYAVVGIVDAVPDDVLGNANTAAGDQPPMHEPTPTPVPSCA